MAQSLTERFEQQVALHGARLALKTHNQALTYDQLNRAANRLARAILTGSRAGEEPIALLFHHGTALITATMAALKTGRPFVQVDDKLPQARARRLIQDAGARSIVTGGANYDRACALAGDAATVVNLDALRDDIADDNLGLAIAPRAIAYIHYTSGSTGEPKGVMSDHASELHSVLVKAEALTITAADRISLLRSHNVGATSDALLALLNGAALCLLELEEQGLAGLGDWLSREKVTVLTCVASVFRHALRHGADRAAFTDVRLVHLGGEPLFRSDIALFKRHFSDGCRLVNRLGISETKTASYFMIGKNDRVEEAVVPVGFALEGYEIAVLDEAGKPVAANIVGEIAVKSRYLARGYWRRPELTQAKFLADPAGTDARLFLSGDLGYLRSDGCLVHAGRKDRQIKIRGCRVELAEVEIAMLEIVGVEQAAVVARPQRDDGARLVAYVVLRSGSDLNVNRIRAALQKTLADYMIPSAFVSLAGLPMTRSGKIDRRRLPAPPRFRAALDVPHAAPRNPLENVLARLWCEVLQLDEIGRDDDFAALGGDSLLATPIVMQVNQMFDLPRPLKTLFATPTVAQLAAWITAQELRSGAAAQRARLKLEIDALTPEQIYQALGDDDLPKQNG